VAVAAHILTHEAVHLRGITDESRAECAALRLLPAVLRDRFGLKSASVRRQLVAFVTRQRPWLPVEYQRAC
jgi:hypothetical protein